MAGYVGRRLLGAVPVLVGVTLVAFLLLHLVPGDPIRLMLGFRATQEQVDQVRADYGLDRPLLDQYLAYLVRIGDLDLGSSIVQRKSVADLVGDRLWPSAMMILYATVLSMLVGIPLAIVSALRRGRMTDLVVRVTSMISFATPAFLVGVLLILLFALLWRLVPTSGYQRDPVGIVRTLTLPSLAIAFYLAPMLIRTLRVSLIEAYGSDHVTAARARGLGDRAVARHALRNSLVPTIALLGVNLGYLLGGAVVIETLFAVPGLGSLLVSSVIARDLPVVQGIALLFALAVILINLVADVVSAVLDPRIRR